MKICVYAICKNELKFVDKWLENMSEADYIVVLDTGSTDGTYEKLKEDSRVTVVEQKEIKPWRFDVARNESMKLCPEDTDVYVCTDFDELFEKGWAKVIRDNWKANYTRGFYTYAWSHNEIGEPEDVFKYDKIHNKNYEWVYPVHEVLKPLDGKEIAIDFKDNIYLHHYQDKNKSRKFYFDLLKLACEENPNDSHIQMLYAREFILRNDLEGALPEFLKCLKMPDIDEPNKRSVLLYCLLHTAEIYFDLNNYDEVIWYCQEFIKEDYTYREPYLILGEVYNEMKMYSLAEAMIENALKNTYQHYTWVEEQGTYYERPYDILSVAQYNLGKLDLAAENMLKAIKHKPNDTRLLKNYIACLSDKLKKLQETKHE